MRLSLFFQLSSLLALSFAHDDSLFTSSVSYCAPPEAILIRQFDISYFASNDSVVFNVTAASVAPNLNVSAMVLLNVYGMKPVNISLDFCHVLGNVLCPLPQYNFSGSGSIPLPQGVDVASHVPSIAYKIPDLEAFAQVTLIDTSTQQVKACVQSTLSNGWSTRQPAVSWATGGLAFLALIACLWYSSAEGSTSLAPQRFIDLMFLYQHIGSTGLLNLNYPVVFTSYTLNFSWALGLFAGSTAIQNAIDSMRRRTGGNGQAAVGVIETVNRKFSPYNDVVVPSPLTRRFVSPPVEIETSGNSLSAGIPTYTNSLGIAATDAFMSVFFTAIILFAIVLVLSLFLLGGVALYARITGKATSSHLKFWARANFLRLSLITFGPIFIFSFYQWTLHDSWLSIVLSVIVCLVVGVTVVVNTIFLLIAIRRSSPDEIDRHMPSRALFSPLYGAYRLSRYWYFIPVFAASFLKSLFVGFGQKSGTVQVIGLLAIESLLGLLTIFARPCRTRRSDTLTIYLCVIRVVSTGLLIPFIAHLEVKPIPRVAIGLVNAVILSVTVVIMFIAIVLNLLPWSSMWRSLRRKNGSMESLPSNASNSDEKSIISSHDRPLNPTPPASHSLPLEMSEPSSQSAHHANNHLLPTHAGAISPALSSASSYTSYGHELGSPRSFS
ncbi:TRP-domain-containing protein [Sistotremastrum niveocremeum HHB9708]|uniref:TRP-domain-containing protein n=1 Tax=Sistotremastrum niveocremeum HHB9708 TaxID=1314777 RepID=A0A165A656_9AGAM|nr:TRP-domain-containing protein [Sistotremastrum niveocremeum HHB9708]